MAKREFLPVIPAEAVTAVTCGPLCTGSPRECIDATTGIQ